MKPGHKFVPTERQLHHAWQLKMNGFTDAEIARKIGVSPNTFSCARVIFLKYNAQRNREQQRIHEANLRSMGINPRGPTKLEKYRLAAVKLAELGENVNKIALQLGIPDTTLRLWMKEDETFNHEMLTAADKLDQRIIKSLVRRAEGFTTREATTTEMSMGGVISQRTTTKRVSRVLPSVKAQELWLSNRRKWLSENKGEGERQTDNRPIEYEIIDNLFNPASAETNVKENL